MKQDQLPWLGKVPYPPFHGHCPTSFQEPTGTPGQAWYGLPPQRGHSRRGGGG